MLTVKGEQAEWYISIKLFMNILNNKQTILQG